MPERRYLRPNEPLAIDQRALHADADRGAFFWMFGGGARPNERVNESIAVVYVRNELDHHDDSYCDSYESILCRLTDAFSGDHRPDWARKETWGDSQWEQREKARFDAMCYGAPSAVIMCLDSPGGVVSGLNETVKAIRALRNKSGIPLIAYVNEMAASAAYALACACDKIYCPPSAILGSIGVISTMISQAAKNKKDGYDVRLITSGARKADGHVHAPISQDAIDVERGRLNQLADAFFKLASKRRGISVDAIRAMQANIYLGNDAVKRRLADGIRSWDALVTDLSARAPKQQKAMESAGGNETDRREGLTGAKMTHRTKEQGNSMDFDELIKKAEKAVAKAAKSGDNLKLVAAADRLAGYKKAKKDAEDEDEEEEEDEDESAKKAAAAADRILASAEAAKKAEKKPAPEEEDDEEKRASKAVLAAVSELTGGKTGAAAVGHLRSALSLAKQTAADVAELKARAAAQTKASIIKDARGKYLTSHDATYLEGRPLEEVQAFVEHRVKSGAIVNVDEDSLVKPKAVAAGTFESLPAEQQLMVNQALAELPANMREAVKTQLVAKLTAQHTERLTAAANGAAGRY